MSSDKIEIEIDGCCIVAEVFYDFTPGERAIIYADPDDCREGSDPEVSVTGLIAENGAFPIDISVLLGIGEIEEHLEEKLRDILCV